MTLNNTVFENLDWFTEINGLALWLNSQLKKKTTAKLKTVKVPRSADIDGPVFDVLLYQVPDLLIRKKKIYNKNRKNL